MVEAAGTAPQTEEINFEDAFAQLALLEEGAAPEKPEEEAPKAAEPASAEPAPAEPAPSDEAAGDETPAEPPKAAEPTPPAPPAKEEGTEEVLQRLAKLVKETPQEPEPQPAAQQSEPPPLYSKEDQEFLQNYEKEWPDVARAESLRRKAEYRELVTYVFNEVAKNITPIVETVQALSQRTHLSDLHSVVEDYDTVRDQVIDWVGKQPAYLQVAYNHVIQNGTAEEVADLIGRYKREVAPASPPTGNASAPAKKTDTELPSATKQAAAALAPVSSKRSAVPQGEPSTFEDAFEAFASKL